SWENPRRRCAVRMGGTGRKRWPSRSRTGPDEVRPVRDGGLVETEIGPGDSLRGAGVSAKRLWNKKKKAPGGSLISGSLQDNGGEEGIRTLETLPRLRP